MFRTVSAIVRRTARERFGWRTLRPGQLDAVRALVKGRDVLVVMPTGAGKSAVYQLAGLLIDGPTVVISPLIALQRDQLVSLAARGTGPGLAAVAVNSAQAASQTSQAWESLRSGRAEFVFLAPEQLANESVVDRLAGAGVALLVVDEAHCVSAWGHSFRPDYLRIGDVRQRLGSPTVVALTATAAPPVRAEIVQRLRLRRPKQIVLGFDRPNLRLQVERFTQEARKRAAVVEQVGALSGTGLVYTATRKDAEQYAAALVGKGHRARAYHAGLNRAEREAIHDGFLSGQVEVVVATSAFGMGIDKPDVRFVVHADVSESLDAYYQEIGRAGRDGAPALAVLLYRSEDLALRTFFASGGADPKTLATVAHAVRRRTEREQPGEPAALERQLHLPHARFTNAVNLLEQAGAVQVDDAGHLHYADRDRPVDDAVAAALEAAQARARVDRSRVEMMRGYAETAGCRRQFLLGYFGEETRARCGNCDVCASGRDVRHAGDGVAGPARRMFHRPANSRYASSARPQPTFPLNAAVAHREWGPGVVMRREPDRITVLFERAGYRTLALAALTADAELLVLQSPRATGRRRARDQQDADASASARRSRRRAR